MTKSLRVALKLGAPLLAGVLFLAGCSGDSDDSAQPGASSTPSGATSTSANPAPPSGGASGGATTSPRPSGNAGKTAGEITLTGNVEPGVEAGCMLLSANGKQYLLLGGDRTLIEKGGKLTVTGRPDPGTLSICQQGEPFQVTTVKKA